jgi:hypothetical protein
MSTVTTFLNLVKPAPLEAFSRATYVNNLDLIDAGVLSSMTKKRHAEWRNSGFAVAGGNVQWDAGPLTVQATETFNNTFTTASATSGAINLTESGLYTITGWTVPGVNPGQASMIIQFGGIGIIGAPNGINYETGASVTRYLLAGSEIRIRLSFQNAATSVTRLTVTKWSD